VKTIIRFSARISTVVLLAPFWTLAVNTVWAGVVFQVETTVIGKTAGSGYAIGLDESPLGTLQFKGSDEELQALRKGTVISLKGDCNALNGKSLKVSASPAGKGPTVSAMLVLGDGNAM